VVEHGPEPNSECESRAVGAVAAVLAEARDFVELLTADWDWSWDACTRADGAGFIRSFISRFIATANPIYSAYNEEIIIQATARLVGGH